VDGEGAVLPLLEDVSCKGLDEGGVVVVVVLLSSAGMDSSSSGVEPGAYASTAVAAGAGVEARVTPLPALTSWALPSAPSRPG